MNVIKTNINQEIYIKIQQIFKNKSKHHLKIKKQLKFQQKKYLKRLKIKSPDMF